MAQDTFVPLLGSLAHAVQLSSFVRQTWLSEAETSAERIDLNIAVERSRLEEGEDFQPVLPTAMFFCCLSKGRFSF